MREAFDSASRAYDSHDGAAAKSYAEDGHSYQAERDRLNAEVRALIEENKTARFSAGAYDSEVQQAKDDLDAFKAKQHEDKRIHQQDKEALAAKAGIPRQYWKDLVIRKGKNGSINIYFGGSGSGDGTGHGHVIIRDDQVIYWREPGQPKDKRLINEDADIPGKNGECRFKGGHTHI